MAPEWKLEADLETVTVSFPTDPPVSLKLKTAEIENMLENLAQFRSRMTPEIPKAYTRGQKVIAIPDPAWATEPEMMQGNTLLHIRDPRYGWLHYMIPREQGRKLVGYLQNQLDAPPPAAQTGKVN